VCSSGVDARDGCFAASVASCFDSIALVGMREKVRVGAHYLGEGKCEFTVWCPFLKGVALEVVHPCQPLIPMDVDAKGYWRVTASGLAPGTLYFYLLNGALQRPDPASFSQPQGVHGPSEIVDHGSFLWEEGTWSGIPLEAMIIYEIHVGTFTPAGNFKSIIGRLEQLRDLGVNTIELMPVAQFPGARNWGYDGVYPFAVQGSYGGCRGLKELVNAAHVLGLAVILDVVYNHLGPEGNYISDFGPYFTSQYKTPWGDAVNFDDRGSDDVRNFFIENALYWFREYHLDALRLDAVHGIYDRSAKPFLEELAEETETFSKAAGRRHYLIAESDLNDSRLIRPRALGGLGIDAQWNDDFHHSLHTMLTKERDGYYLDFGEVEHLARACRQGFVYSWDYSLFRRRRHGNSSQDRPAHQFIVCSQNHDQVGNRRLGERLSALVSFEALKLAAGAVLLSPFVPLIFMGEEYGEESPFLYFVDHSDPELVQAVRGGREKEFQAFECQSSPSDPQALETFEKSRLRWEIKAEGKHKVLLDFYRTLLSLRRSTAALANLDKDALEVSAPKKEKILFLRRWYEQSEVLCIMNFDRCEMELAFALPYGRWRRLLDSADRKWLGPGSATPEVAEGTNRMVLRPTSLLLYQKEPQ
jgi:maltooligosyltrehalose trehalohydrolase